MDAPNILHRVMVRAVEATTIFRADRHGADIVARLASLGKQGTLTVSAWALVSNRLHLLVHSRPRSLTTGTGP